MKGAVYHHHYNRILFQLRVATKKIFESMGGGYTNCLKMAGVFVFRVQF